MRNRPVGETLLELAVRLESEEISLGDYLRLLQLRDEVDGESPGPIVAGWAEWLPNADG